MFKRPKPENEVNFYRGDAVGDYMISHQRGKNGGIAIAELSPGERDRMAKEVELRSVRDNVYAGGSYASNFAICAAMATNAMPLWAAATGYVTTLGTAIGTQMRTVAMDKHNRRAQRKIATAISATPERYMFFRDDEVKISLPSAVLDEVITFESEEGQAQKTVEQLALSVKNDLFGLTVSVPREKDEPFLATVSPGRFMAHSLKDFSAEQKGQFLTASISSVEQLHRSVQALPRYGYEAPGDGLRERIVQLHAGHNMGVLAGALGVYGTLRAQAGVNVSEMIKNVYATYGTTDVKEDPLLADAFKFSRPTTEDLEWQEITRVRQYISLMDISQDG